MQIYFKIFNVDVTGNLQVLEILFLLVPGNQLIIYVSLVYY